MTATKQFYYNGSDLKVKVYLLDGRTHIRDATAEEITQFTAIEADRVNQSKPISKVFDTGYVHLQFDITTQEYKDFCSDPRVSEFLNNQSVEMTVQGIDFRKSLITVLQTEGVLGATTAGLIQSLLDTWRSEVKDTTV